MTNGGRQPVAACSQQQAASSSSTAPGVLPAVRALRRAPTLRTECCGSRKLLEMRRQPLDAAALEEFRTECDCGIDAAVLRLVTIKANIAIGYFIC